VQCTPRRLEAVEAAVRGKAKGEATAQAIGTLASNGAEPLNHNGFKMPLVDSLAKRALLA